MIYNSFGFIVLGIFIVLFIASFFLRKYKVYYIILPYKGNFLFLDLLGKLLILLIFFIIVLIPFNIGIYQGTKIKKVPTLNIQILLDVSLSMTAKDFKPDRFHTAKSSLVNFINSLDTNYNIGLIAFSGKPFVYIPITDDKKALIYKISNMSMADFPPTLDFVGTAIGDAILLGKKQLLNYTQDNQKPGVIILITDGDSNKGTDPLKAIEYEEDIPIFVGAIGKDATFVVGQDRYGNDVPTYMDITSLKQIAEKTGGEFKKLEKKEDFLEILGNLYSYVKEYEKIERIQEYTYINFYLKIILIFLLLTYMIFFLNFNIKKRD